MEKTFSNVSGWKQGIDRVLTKALLRLFTFLYYLMFFSDMFLPVLYLKLQFSSKSLFFYIFQFFLRIFKESLLAAVANSS